MSMFQLSQSAGNLNVEKDKTLAPHNQDARPDDDESAAFLQVKDDTVEVDFYKNPTILSRLLLNHKYSSAIKRLRSHPEEAHVWVAHKRNPFKREQCMRRYLRKDRSDNSFAGSIRSISSSQKSFYHITKHQRDIMVDYSLRQLPIHMACGNLIRPSKPEEQGTLEKLISLLIVTHPQGCEERDHDGKLPLHEAIWYNASAETISMMLIANPSSLHEKDKFGRSPLDLNRIRSGGDKEKVKDLLVRGAHFWKHAQSEALASTKDEEATKNSSSLSTTSVQSLRAGPDGNLTPVVRDISKQVRYTGRSSSASTSTPQSHEHGDDCSVVEPISWVKLEQRAVYLEQLLAGMYEKNYELEETVEELTRERLGLQDELEKMRKRGGLCDDETIAEENERLREEIDGLKRALSDAENNKSMRISGSVSKEGSVGSLESTDKYLDAGQIQYLQERNVLLEEEMNELNGRIQEYEGQVNRLEIIAGMNKVPGRGEESDADSTLVSIPEDASPGDPAAKKELQSTRSLPAAEEEAREDLESLLGSLSANSRFATERFLAGKVVLLEERLKEEMAAREADVRANSNENSRLLMENEALQSEVNRLSSRNIIAGPSLKSIPKKQISQKKANSDRRRLNNKAASSRSDVSEDPSVVFQTDDLDEILQGAAAMYNSRRSFNTSSQSASESVGEDLEFDALLNEAFTLYGTKQSSDSLLSTSTSKLGEMPDGTIGEIRTEVERIESVYGKPVPLEIKMSLVSAASSVSLGTKQSEDENEELDDFLEEAAKFYGKPIPSDLRTAMQGTSLASLSGRKVLPSRKPDEDDDLGKIFEEAARLYQKPIPKEVQTAVRDVVTSSSVRDLPDDTLQPASFSPATSSSLASDEELLVIIREAERAYGKQLSPDLKYALLTASTSLSLEGSSTADADGRRKNEYKSESEEGDEIEKLFDETEKVYHKPIPSGVKVVMRNAMSSRVELDRPASEVMLSPETSASFDTDDDLLIIIREAEKAYGKSLPPDLKYALLTASISSGMSLRSLGESSKQVFEGSSSNRRLSRQTVEEDDLEKMFEDAMRIYRRPIPSGVKAVMRDAVSSSVRPDGSSALQASQSSRDSGLFLDPYDELDSIIVEAEQAYGKTLSPELKHALLTASISSRVSSRGFEESSEQLDEDFHMEKVFEEAAILYRQPIPTGVKSVVRDAMSSRSGLRGSVSAVPTAEVSPTESSSFESFDELQSIIREAEKAYGKPLSPDLKHALLTASISSHISMRSLGYARASGLDEIPEGVSSTESGEERHQKGDMASDDLDGMFVQAAKRYSSAESKISTGAPVLDVAVDHPRTRPLEAPGTSNISGLTMSTGLYPLSSNAESRDTGFASDSLDAIFSEAAGKNATQGVPRETIEMDASVSSEEKTYLPRNLSASVKKTSAEQPGAPRFNASSKSISSTTPDDDLESIIREAETSYGKSLPDDLKRALRDASMASGLSFRTSDLVGESSRLGGASGTGTGDDDDLERMFEQAQYKVFHKAPVLRPVIFDEEDDLEKLFEEAARLYDKPIPPELMSAMRDAVSPNDGDESSESSASSGDWNSLPSEGYPVRDASQSELLFDTGRMFSKPISMEEAKEEASSPVANDDLDELFAEAAKGYGRT